MKLKSNYDVIIIGAGPAGLSAAIYLKRAGVNVLILEENTPGGTLNKILKIENYPGYIDEDGTTLAFRMYSQIERLEIDLKQEKVVSIKKEDEHLNVVTKGNEYKAKYIIIATGKMPRKLDIKNANKFENKGLSYCITCDGTLYKNKDIAIVGGGNFAMEAVSYMKDIAKKIYVINTSKSLKADEINKKVLEKSNVKVINEVKIDEIIGNDYVEKIRLDNGNIIDVSAIFVCMGQISNSGYYQNLDLKKDKKGIVVDNDMKTSNNNVYACGDAISKSLYQVVTATSEGAIAANSIIKKLNSKIC